MIKVELQRKPHDQDMLDRARTMSPAGARFVLDLIEKHKNKMNFADDVILTLVERAGDAPKQSHPQVEAVIAKLVIAPKLVTVNGETYEVEE
jgi:hypothetical protein